MGFLLVAALLGADSKPLERARTLYAEVQYGEAIALLDSLLASGSATAAEREQATLLIGFCHVGLGNQAAAKKRFVEVLELNIDAKLPPGTSPKIREVFEGVRKELKTKSAVTRAEPFLVPVERGYLARFVGKNLPGAPILFVRKEGATGYAAEPLQQTNGVWSAELSPGTYAFYVEVRDSDGRVQTPLGSVAAPERVVVPVRQVEKAPLAVATTQVEAGPPVYKRWWFWTLIGGVVVAAAAGAATGIVLSERATPRPGSLSVTFEVPQ